MITQETEIKKKKTKQVSQQTNKQTNKKPRNVCSQRLYSGWPRISWVLHLGAHRFAYLSSHLHEVGCWVKGSSVEKTSLPLESAGCDSAVLSQGSAAAHGAKEKAGSSPQLSCKPALCPSFPISQRVQRLPLHWMEEDPITDTVLPHPHWVGTLPSPRSQGRAIRLV